MYVKRPVTKDGQEFIHPRLPPLPPLPGTSRHARRVTSWTLRRDALSASVALSSLNQVRWEAGESSTTPYRSAMNQKCKGTSAASCLMSCSEPV